MSEKPFWMIWNPCGHNPVVKHYDRDGAIIEAERLARKNQGETFVVLQAIAARVVNDMTRIEFKPPDERNVCVTIPRKDER